MFYDWNEEAMIPDSTSLPGGPQVTLAKGPPVNSVPAEKSHLLQRWKTPGSLFI